MPARLLAVLVLLALAAGGLLFTAAAVRPASPALPARIAVVPTTTATPVPAGPPATDPVPR